MAPGPVGQQGVRLVERLLTTRDLQELLQVDRITIYRMLEAGELPGVKIGGQWRFPEPEVRAWLEGIKAKHALSEAAARPRPDVLQALSAAEAPAQPPRLTDLVSTTCLQNLQDAFAEAVGAAALVTDLQGTPLTNLSHACAFCRLGRTAEEFRRRCTRSWTSLADTAEAPPQVRLCHAGIGYAVAPVVVQGKQVGLVVGGQFWSQRPDHGQLLATANRLAAECGLPAADLLEAMQSVPVFSEEHAVLFTRLLATIANTVSEIGLQAYLVRQRLQQIAQIVKNL